MRLSILALPLLALVPFTFALGTTNNHHVDLMARQELATLSTYRNKTLYASKMQKPGGEWHRPDKKCFGNPLRDPKDHCDCKPGLIEVRDGCCCGDSRNTLLTLQGCEYGGCNNPVCVCSDPNAREWAREHDG